jgi:hypothetical protein
MNEFSPHGNDLFGTVNAGKHDSLLGDKFLVPPFTVLSARDGWWQERKRAWLALGIQSELGRGDILPGGGGSPHQDVLAKGLTWNTHDALGKNMNGYRDRKND